MRKIVTLSTLIVLFSLQARAQVDSTIGLNVSGSAANNYRSLAHALCDGVAGDRMKVNAIFNWITHNIKYDVKQLEKATLEPDKVETVLKKRRAVCDGYSKLFVALCEEVGIKAVQVEGYAKDWTFDNGDQFYIPRHAWNAVYVEGKWQLVEPTWAAGYITQEPGWLKKLFTNTKKNPLAATGKLKFKFRYNPQHFLMDPLTFRKKHLPTDPLWQLTDSMMPIAVFEAGDSAIERFNTAYPTLVQNMPELDRINKLDEWKRSQEVAERVTNYNPRYRLEMAFKHHADALDSLSTSLKNGGTSGQALLIAKDELKKSEKEISTQKSTIGVEYAALKKKNKTKSLQAKEHIRILRSDTKRLIASCKSKATVANNRYKGVINKEKAAIKKNDALATAKSAPPAVKGKEEDPNSPALVAIEENVAMSMGKIQDLQEDLATRNAIIAENKRNNDKKLDSLVQCFMLCDSALVKETIARLNMHDDYDDEVIVWSNMVKQYRLQDLDSMQKYFIAGYDTVLQQYEAARALHWNQLEEYRKSMKEFDKYRRKNMSNTTFLSQYNTIVSDYNKSNEAYMQLINDFALYIQENKSLFPNIINLYKRQEKLAEYMEKSEDTRKKLEEKYLTEKESFDKKENEKQMKSVKESTRKLEKMLMKKA
ncbi:MAG: hypothetical protein JNL72_06265 [Flavipsychrobacter sp.]|nr:hypothetical protein [Flavipsychrobacter sp.]